MKTKLWGRVVIRMVVALVGCAAEARAAGDPARTRELVAVVGKGDAALHEKARACQELAIVGTVEAVPVLAGLLGSDPLAHYAREALEAMGTAEADAALRDALGKTRGKFLVGVVNSLGMRRDAVAVPALSSLVSNPEAQVARSALLALARIDTADAHAVVRATLETGDAARRESAAEASLLIADALLLRRETARAAEWFERVRGVRVSEKSALSALRGVLLARGVGGVQQLIETLRSGSAPQRAVGLRALRDLEGSEVVTALAEALPTFPADVQALAIDALVDRGDARVVMLVEGLASADDSRVRMAALRALGKIGRESSVGLLLRAMEREEGGAELEMVRRSLAQIGAANADGEILRALATARTPIRVALLGVLGERGARPAMPALLQAAREPEPLVARAALRALGLVARPSDLPQLIALTLELTEDDARMLADRAIHAAAMKILEPEKRAEPLLVALSEAGDAAKRAALLRPLGAVVRAMGGDAAARAAVIALLQDPDAGVRAAAVKCLADWPDTSPASALLAVATESRNEVEREVAFDAVARMAGKMAAGAETERAEALAMLTRLNGAVKTNAERMQILSALGNVRRIEAYRLLEPYLELPAVKTEAALAVVQIAPALLAGRDGAEVRAMVQRIAETAEDADVKAKARRVLQGGGAPAAAKKGKKKE